MQFRAVHGDTNYHDQYLKFENYEESKGLDLFEI